MLPGSDHQVHVYKENSADHEYKEIDRDLFPEFVKTPSPVIYVDIWYTEDFREYIFSSCLFCFIILQFFRRITTFSCECGYVKLTRVCTITNKLIYNFSTKFNDFISCVSIYSDQNNVNKFSKVNNEMESSKTDEKPVLNLLVTNTILPAVIFRNVLKYGLSDYQTLPRHDRTSILTSCEIADINFDGQKEILIGSSSQVLIDDFIIYNQFHIHYILRKYFYINI